MNTLRLASNDEFRAFKIFSHARGWRIHFFSIFKNDWCQLPLLDATCDFRFLIFFKSLFSVFFNPTTRGFIFIWFFLAKGYETFFVFFWGTGYQGNFWCNTATRDTFRRKLKAVLFARNACVMSILKTFDLCPCTCEKSEKKEARSWRSFKIVQKVRNCTGYVPTKKLRIWPIRALLEEHWELHSLPTMIALCQF